jgi:hypothetical protein
LTISNPRLESGIFKYISWLNRSFFVGVEWGFLKKGVKTYPMAPMSLFNSTTYFFVLTFSL